MVAIRGNGNENFITLRMNARVNNPCMMTSANVIEAAKAVNSLLHLSASDQESLLADI